MTEEGSPADELPWLDGVPPIVDCSEGWNDLIRRLHNRLMGIDPDYRVMQVKEKFGGLRYYIAPSRGLNDRQSERMYALTWKAEAESLRICEVCGEPGETRGGSWYRTLCDAHDRERKARYAALKAAAVVEDDAVAGRRRCPTHGVPLIEEPGGLDQPTIHGRIYCPTCQEELMVALEEDEP